MEKTLIKQFESGLNIDQKSMEFTFTEYGIINKVIKGYKLNLPNEIFEFLSSDVNFNEENFEREKLSSFFQSENQINTNENPYLQDVIILKSVFCFIGGINSKNEISKISVDDVEEHLTEENYVENCGNFSKYLEKNMEIIFGKFRLKDLTAFTNAMRVIGIDLKQENILFASIRNFVLSKNKILVLITPANNFWIKSSQVSIGTKSYDKKLNNYTYLYYNIDLIKKFYDKVANHPRCILGYLSSMTEKNLVSCIDSIRLMIKNFTKYHRLDQNAHDNLAEKREDKPIFVRNIDKIIKECKGHNINETNLVILEAEKEKISNTKSNSIEFITFSEEIIASNSSTNSDAVVDYITQLLDDCDCDIREYIAKKTI